MLKRLIKTIRRQPKARRDSIAMGIAGTFTAFVFMVWIYNVPSQMSSLSEEKETDSLPSFSHLFSEVKSQASAVKANFSGTDEETSSTTGQSKSEQNKQTTSESSSSYMNASTSSSSASGRYASSTLFNSIIETPLPATTSPRVVKIVTIKPAS